MHGRPFLYDATFTSSNGDASCASCHIFGDFDEPGLGPRQPRRRRHANPRPINLDRCRVRLGPDVGGTDVDDFHPMKGPMTTQTLRGMDNHGADALARRPHGGNGVPRRSRTALRRGRWRSSNFIVAFPGLLGATPSSPDADMQAFTDFVLQVTLPAEPDPHARQLAHARAAGRAATSSSAPRADGSTSATAPASTATAATSARPGAGLLRHRRPRRFEGETQIFKVPHLRNMYQKVGMFGMPAVPVFDAADNGNTGDQVRGFGFPHDGASTRCSASSPPSSFTSNGVGFPLTTRDATAPQTSSSSCSRSTPTWRRSSASRSR